MAGRVCRGLPDLQRRLQMREERLEAKSRANWRYDRGAACCNNMPCASNRPSRTCTLPPPCIGRLYSLAIGLSPLGPPVFCRPHSITLADYSALCTCKRGAYRRYSVADPFQAAASSSSYCEGTTYGGRLSFIQRARPPPFSPGRELAPTRR